MLWFDRGATSIPKHYQHEFETTYHPSWAWLLIIIIVYRSVRVLLHLPLSLPFPTITLAHNRYLEPDLSHPVDYGNYVICAVPLPVRIMNYLIFLSVYIVRKELGFNIYSWKCCVGTFIGSICQINVQWVYVALTTFVGGGPKEELSKVSW